MGNYFKRKGLDLMLDSANIPEHIGIIMDGNGRWANAKGLARSIGHRAGVERLKSVLRLTDDLGVKALSVYAFSTENWGRPEDEVGALMGLLIEFMKLELNELHKENVRITFMGDIENMPEKVYNALITAKNKTENNTGLVFNIALNYGSRAEIVNAAKELAKSLAEGTINLESIDEKAFEEKLYSKGLPPLDLLIRTSNEMRLSNFMLYQAAYSEFVFVEEHWPEFDDECYIRAIKEYQKRQRRFGKL